MSSSCSSSSLPVPSILHYTSWIISIDPASLSCMTDKSLILFECLTLRQHWSRRRDIASLSRLGLGSRFLALSRSDIPFLGVGVLNCEKLLLWARGLGRCHLWELDRWRVIIIPWCAHLVPFYLRRWSWKLIQDKITQKWFESMLLHL